MNPPPSESSASTASGTVIDGGRFVRMLVAAVLAEEGQEDRAEDVERGHAGGDHADPVHPRRVLVGGHQDRVLAEESGNGRDAGDGDGGAQHASRT